MDFCCRHMVYKQLPNGYWTLDKLKKISIKYKTKAEWRKKHPASYSAAYVGGYLKILMKNSVKTWTLKICKNSAAKYKTRSEWEKGNRNAYYAARRNKWSTECCVHMKRLRAVYLKNLDTDEVFLAPKAYMRYNINRNAIRLSIGRNGKCRGYHWAYCDENGKILNERTKK